MFKQIQAAVRCMRMNFDDDDDDDDDETDGAIDMKVHESLASI